MTLAEEPIVRLILEGNLCARPARSNPPRMRCPMLPPRPPKPPPPRPPKPPPPPPPHSGHADPLRAAANLSPAGEPRSDLVDGTGVWQRPRRGLRPALLLEPQVDMAPPRHAERT